MKKVSTETITRTVLLFVTLTNIVMTTLGKNPLPFSGDDIYGALSVASTVGATLWAWWKNNSFTDKAIEADKYLKNLKGDVE